MTQIKRIEIHRNILKYIFGVFGFIEQANKREKKKEKNYLHGKAPNKQKKNKEIFWVFFLIL